MQLKIKRSQKGGGGILSGAVTFCIDACVELTPQEQANVKLYRLGNQLIYSSEGAQQAAAGSLMAMDAARGRGIAVNNVDDFLASTTDTIGHGLKAIALGAIAHMKLKITIDGLQKGQHIECKSLDEVLGAEQAIMVACKTLRG